MIFRNYNQNRLILCNHDMIHTIHKINISHKDLHDDKNTKLPTGHHIYYST